MSDLSADPGFTLLGSAAPVDDKELAGLYAYPEGDQTRPWVRANFISSIDGGATMSGTSGGLAGPGDRTVFTLLRALADIIVVGAGTIRVENYGGAHLGVAERQRRRDRGQTEVPRLAIVSGSGRLDRDLRVFTETELPPLVLTSATAAEDTRRRLAGHAEVLDCSGNVPDRVDVATVLAAVAARGHRRVLTEGGPTLLDSLVEGDLLDELCLTVAPYLVGGRAPRIATGTGEQATPMRCAHLLSDESGYLYGRYVKSTRL
ncbi:pyrimidine reductase family protein [[Mycobacterium] nativiensis]|uniref:Pyrimidine reductase family protein n=1 Tax=[Mycobacterium] nativiensis TaxID=2855503 RepID=A0ABU5XSL0_9MYCO|nr:pyrimidine reductase family protein [Mycolicibacter sp. MYC340]MEB3030960.1 pyrimidine reductase family protein [Mycolicibacter sp. MYC340]